MGNDPLSCYASACWHILSPTRGLQSNPFLTRRYRKPDPSCYLMGLGRIGLAGPNENENVLVVEDSPAGIKAGKAAGCKVLGLVTR